jgi:hypothetical protein
MLRANLKIISVLRNFLLQVGNKTEDKTLFSFCKEDFTRRRKLTFENLVLFILRTNKKTLSIEIENFFKELQSHIRCTVSAFSQQRLKLHPAFFFSWNWVLCDSFYQAYENKIKRWKGYRVFACDGSSISLVNRPSLANYFGGQSNSDCSYVLAKTFYCYDALNELVFHADIKPYRYGEFQMACDFIDSGKLQSDMLLVFDRHYSAYNIAALVEYNEQDVKFLIRTNENYNYTKQFLKSKKDSVIIELMPSNSSIKNLKKRGYLVKRGQYLKVRLVKAKLANKKVHVYMTNLLDEKHFPTSEINKMYALRWKAETCIDFQKNILQLESMSGLTPLTVMQDFYATVFLSNLHNLLIKPAQVKIDKTILNTKYPMKINNNIAAAKIKEVVVCIFITENPKNILRQLHDIFIRSPLPVRKNRSFPRERKNKLTKSKHRTFSNYKPAC